MSPIWENQRFNFKKAILIALLFHIMVFYVHFNEYQGNLDYKRQVRTIRIHNFPIPPKKVDQKNPVKKENLKPIPAPVPEEMYTINPPITFKIEEKELFSDDQFYIFNYEFRPPAYDDFLIGVLGRTAKEGELLYSPKYIEYPEKDKRAYIQGKILLKLTINKKGKVVSALVLEGVGNSAIEDAAKEAALKRLYKPVTKNGKPVYFQDEWTINFNLK